MLSTFWCVEATPFGSPVVPEVYRRSARSDSDVGTWNVSSSKTSRSPNARSIEMLRPCAFLVSAGRISNGRGLRSREASRTLDRSEEHTSELQSRQYLVC